MTKIRLGTAALVLLLLLSGCGETESGSDRVPEEQVRCLDGLPEEPTVTVLVYLVGSDLESQSGLATQDLEEMCRADLGDRVTLVLQTMGSRAWQDHRISSSARRYTVEEGTLVPQGEELGILDSTDPDTLREFVLWGARNYPAQRYMLLFWDHGGGPVYGYGFDEFQGSNDSLTLDEMRRALRSTGISFDFIGFDACLMGSLETALALAPCADCLIASEDFVSGLGWEYQYWLTRLGDDPGMDTLRLGQIIVDTYVTESREAGDGGVLAVVDLSQAEDVFACWRDWAYANEDVLIGTNYSWATEVSRKGLYSHWLDRGIPEEAMWDYRVTDLLALAETVDTPGHEALAEALARAVVYAASEEEDRRWSGLSVTLPYGDEAFYRWLAPVFAGCGLDADYVAWLGRFVTAPGAGTPCTDWRRWDAQWDNSTAYGGWAGRR